MSTMFFKKSLKFLAIAMAGLYNESCAAAAFTDTLGVEPGVNNVIPAQKTSVFSTTGGSGDALITGNWDLDANHQSFWTVASSDNTNPKGVAFSGNTLTAGNNTKITIMGNGNIDFSNATLTGPAGTNSMAYFSLYTDHAKFSGIAGLAQKFILPAAMTGNWTIESLMDGTVIDTNVASAMPAFTVKATNSVYFGGIRGLSGTTNSYATSFGGATGAIVTGPGIVKLGEVFSIFTPTWTSFTGSIETNSEVTLGSQTYPIALNAGQNTATLILNSANTVKLGSTAVTLKKVISENDGAVLSAVTGATVAIAELDLTKSGMTLYSPAGIASVIYNIGKISDGSDKPLTLNNAGTAMTVNITAGRTDGGIIRTGTTTGITLTQP